MSEQDRALPGAATESPAVTPAGQLDPRAGGTGAHLRAVFRSARPRQWTKNLIVYMALLFSINQEWEVSEPSSWGPLVGWATLTFFLFCMISSAQYLVNDVVDRESDQLHPRKRNRPIAAGLLSTRAALIWAVALGAVALGTGFALSAFLAWQVGVVLAGYAVLMVAYSYYL